MAFELYDTQNLLQFKSAAYLFYNIITTHSYCLLYEKQYDAAKRYKCANNFFYGDFFFVK